MENINKLISLFLGLIVVVIFFAVISGRIDLKGKFFKLGKGSTTPTPTPKTQPIKVTSEVDEGVHLYQKPTLTQAQKYSKTTSIPATGAPTIFLPLAFSSFFGGVWLRKLKNN